MTEINLVQSVGMDARTGKALTGIAHLKQSIEMIITTQIGTRVMRRNFGSTVPELIDHPANKQTLMLMYAAIALALKKFEPRLRLNRIYAEFDGQLATGKALLTIDGVFLGDKVTVSTRL